MTYCITFSPTGSTLRIARYLSTFFGKYETIDLCDYQKDFKSIHLDEESLVIIAVPAFRGRVPSLAAQRLSQIKANNPAILLCVYGNRDFDDTLVELQDICTKIGLNPIAAISAIAKHSECLTLASARPDDLDFDILCDMAMQIKVKLEKRDYSNPLIEGNRPYKKDDHICIVPETTIKCTKCKSCAILCPAQAINYREPKIVDNSKCISCARCIHVCPTGAKVLNKEEVLRLEKFLKPYHDVRKEPKLFI